MVAYLFKQSKTQTSKVTPMTTPSATPRPTVIRIPVSHNQRQKHERTEATREGEGSLQAKAHLLLISISNYTGSNKLPSRELDLTWCCVLF